MPNDEASQAQPPDIEDRVAELESKIGSSWALKTQDDYEADFRERIKGEILTYTIKLAVPALVVLGGAGYLFIRATILNLYEQQDQQTFRELNTKFENTLRELEAGTEWNKLHDYAKNYMYLADFNWYAASKHTREQLDEIHREVTKAEKYFKLALRSDAQQATSYWELGQLHYSDAIKYGDSELCNPEWALLYYKKALKYYTDAEAGRGWRADALYMISKVTLGNAQRRLAEAQKAKDPLGRKTARQASDDLLKSARENLERAVDEYSHAIPESQDLIAKWRTEANQLLVDLDNGRWQKVADFQCPSPARTSVASVPVVLASK